MSRKKPEPPCAVRPYAEVEGVRVNPKLVDHLVSVLDLVPDPENARLHGERNLDAVEASLKRFGFQLPILYDPATMRVVAGNCRLKVATERLGWLKAPAIPFMGTPEEFAAYAIMDNRTAELAEWDWQQLGSSLKSLFDGDLFTGIEMGFVDYELAPILRNDWAPRQPDENETFEHEEPHSVKFTHNQWVEIQRALACKGRVEPRTDVASMLFDLARSYANAND